LVHNSGILLFNSYIKEEEYCTNIITTTSITNNNFHMKQIIT